MPWTGLDRSIHERQWRLAFSSEGAFLGSAQLRIGLSRMIDVPRRTVLTAGMGAACLMALGIDITAAEPAGATTLLVRSDYRRAVGRVFTAKHGRHSYRLRLEHISDLAHTTAAQRRHSFNLVFAPVGSAHVPDGIYVLRSTHVPVHSLFLSSIGSHRAMQALVNRTR